MSRKNDIATENLTLIAFFSSFLLLNIRSIHRIKNVNFWAEDAAIFASSALAKGWETLYFGLTGFQVLIQRFIAKIGVYLVPLDQYPLFYHEAYIICAALVLSYLTHDDFEHIVPGKKNRFFLILVLCFASGLGECLGNLCNLHWFFSLGLGLMILRKLESRTTNRHIVAATLFAVSMGQSIVFIPFFFLRWILQNKGKSTMHIMSS